MVSRPRVETVGTEPFRIIDWSPERTAVVINNNGTEVLSLGVDVDLTTATGFPIQTGQVIVFSREFGDDPTLERWAISGAAGQNVRIMEEYGISLTTALLKLAEAIKK